MWSMCKCVSRMSSRRGSLYVSPTRRMPVPASRTMIVPSVPSTSTHAVLPPYRTVSGPALAIEPRVPHRQTRTSAWNSLLRPLPEHRHRPYQMTATAQEREGGNFNESVDAVESAHPQHAVDRPPFAHGDRCRHLVGRD